MLSTLSNKNADILSGLYLIKEQNVNYNDSIIFDSDDNSMHELSVLDTGMYIINVSCQFEEPSIVGLFINGIEDSIYQTETHNYKKNLLSSSSVIPSYLLIHQILNLTNNNLISFKYLSNGPNKIINLENRIKIWKLT